MIDPIAKLRSPEGTLLSVYVNRIAPATRAAIVDLLKPLRTQSRGRIQDKLIRADAERIIELASRIDTDTAPAVAIFASQADGIFEFLPLTDPVENVAMVGPRPYLRPLRAQPRPMRVGVLVADTARVRTFLSTGGVLQEIGDEMAAEPAKENYGGFGGLEEHKARARADDLATKLWRQAGRRLLEVHQDQPLEMLVLGGHDEHLDLTGDQLHAYLRALPHQRISIDVRTFSMAELADQVGRAIESQRHEAEGALLDRLLAGVDSGFGAASGLPALLEAANAHAVDHLVVAGPYAKEGVLCDNCGWLGRTGTACPVCGSGLFEVGDVVSAAMDATVEAGGKVTIATQASRLDAVGVAAFTRFSVR